MNSAYELTVVLSPKLTDDKHKQAIKDLEVIAKKLGGEITSQDVWGTRPLAYAIKKNLEGVFVVLGLNLSGDKVKELDTQLVLEDKILRHLLIKSEISGPRSPIPAGTGQAVVSDKVVATKKAPAKKTTKKTVKKVKKVSKK